MTDFQLESAVSTATSNLTATSWAPGPDIEESYADCPYFASDWLLEDHPNFPANPQVVWPTSGSRESEPPSAVLA